MNISLPPTARLIPLITILLGTASAHGTLLLYEPFSYGGTASNLNAVNGTALGLDGTTYSGSSTTAYHTAGMSFGDLHVTGGNASLTYVNGSFATNRGLDFNAPVGGTIYGSYLFRATGDGGNSDGITGPLFGGGSGVNDNTAYLAVPGNAGAATQTVIGGVRSYALTTGGTVIATGTSLGTSNTGLVLFEVTNIGAANGETQSISMWMLTESQFASFKTSGLNSSALNSASTGSGATDVLQRANYTLNVSAGNNITFDSSDFLVLFAYRAQHDIDELRISNSSLDEVTPVPEPSSAMLLGGIAGVLLVARRRRACR